MKNNPNQYIKLCSECNTRHDVRKTCDPEILASYIAERENKNER